MNRFLKSAILMTAIAPLASVPIVGAFAQTPPTPPATMLSNGNTITGKVSDVFGAKFIVEANGVRTLVETGPAHRGGIEVKSGEDITVTGFRRADNTFEAAEVTFADGRRVTVREARGEGPRREARGDGPRGDDRRDGGPRGERRGDGPRGEGPRHDRPDSAERIDRAELKRIVEAEGYVWQDDEDIEVKRRHYEVEAEDRNGNDVEIHVDFSGMVKKVDLDDPTYDMAGLRAIVEKAGYAWKGDVDRKKRHYEVEATNANGEDVELHVDFSGEIYKEKRDR